MITLSSAPASDWQVLVRKFLESKPKNPLIAVLGPTASGKTGFSIELARELASQFNRKAEIVNADSRQIYKFLDIGTAKITESDMKGVPHHLFSLLDPKEEVSIAWYQKKVFETIDTIYAKNSIPLLVGGSMLYLSSIIDGLTPVASSDPGIRERLNREYEIDGGVTLMKRLQKVDPESAAAIPIQNKVYLVRALEIFEATGQPKSLQKKVSHSPYDLLIFGMTVDREELKNRIQKRTEQMLRSGWIEEVQSLMKRGYTKDDPGMKSLGYREIFSFLEKGESDVNVLAELISMKVCQYAKRQMTWWRGDPRIHWL